ncbi:MAG: hypothetical protein ABR559_08800, partial [Gemmatimonadota bacterium]
QALALAQQLSAADPVSADHRQGLSRTYARLGRVLGLAGEPGGALDAFVSARRISQGLAAGDTVNMETQHDLVAIESGIGDQLMALDRRAEARASYTAAVERGEATVRRDPRHTRARRSLALAQRGLGSALARSGNPARGVALQLRSLATLQQLSAADPLNVDLQHEVAAGLAQLGATYAAHADRRAACRAFRDSQEKWRALEQAGTLSPASSQAVADAARSLQRCAREPA